MSRVLHVHLFAVYRLASSLLVLPVFLVDGVVFLSWLQGFGHTLAFLQGCFLVTG